MEEYDTSDIVKTLIAAGELSLKELVDHIQSFLIKNSVNWTEQNAILMYQTSFSSESFFELQKFVQNYCLIGQKNFLNHSILPQSQKNP